MIDTCADDLVAALYLELDTTPPRVTITASEAVEPPDAWRVTLTANEDIGGATLMFIDSLGVEHALSYAQTAPGVIEILIPSLDLSTGDGRLYAAVKDLVCNVTPLTIPVLVLRPRPWDTELTILGDYAAEVTVDEAFTAELSTESAFASDLNVDEAFSVEITMESTYAVTLEVFDAE